MGWSEDVCEDDMTTTIWIYTFENYEQSVTYGAWRSRESAIAHLKASNPNLIWEDSINDESNDYLVGIHKGIYKEEFTLSTMELEDE